MAPDQAWPSSDRRLVIASAVSVAALFVWSAIHPYDRFTWFLEVVPALIGIPILAATGRRFRLTTLLYVLIALHIAILLVGGHYTYARVPWFNTLRDSFRLQRNDFDRLGHFAQGFVPALLSREILLRLRVVRRGGWLAFIVLCICLAISAIYELFEWQMAVWSGTAADDFLGTQGDSWDTQKDMATALIGAGIALALFSRWHDREIARLEGRQTQGAVAG